MNDSRTALYRYYDRHGLLLYVGITGRGVRRNAEHNKNAEWWPLVASQEVEHFDTRDLALSAEKSAIERLRPPFNQQHNPDHRLRRRAYFDASAVYEDVLDGSDLFKMAGAINKRIPLRLVDANSDGSVSWACSSAMTPVARHVVFLEQTSIHDTRSRGCGHMTSVEPSGAEVTFSGMVRHDKISTTEIETAELVLRIYSKPVVLDGRVLHLKGAA